MKYELSLTSYLIPTHLNYHCDYVLFSLANNGKEMQHNTHSATQRNTHSAHNAVQCATQTHRKTSTQCIPA